MSSTNHPKCLAAEVGPHQQIDPKGSKKLFRKQFVYPILSVAILFIVCACRARLNRCKLGGRTPTRWCADFHRVTAGGHLAQRSRSGSIVAEMRTSEYSESNYLIIRLTLEQPDVATRWYVFTSGQYAVAPQLDLSRYCAPGPEAMRRQGGDIDCADGGISGSRGVTYHFNNLLGFVNDGHIQKVTDSIPATIEGLPL